MAADLHAASPRDGSPPVAIPATAPKLPAAPPPAVLSEEPPPGAPPGSPPGGEDAKAGPDRPVATLTKATVEERVSTREAQITAQCAVVWVALKLTIRRGHASLTHVNGMTFSEQDQIHSCVREQLHGLTFPQTDKPASFSLTIKRKDPG